MRVAKLENNIVVAIMEIARPIADYPQIELVEAGMEVVIGFSYDGSVFTPHATHQAEVDEELQTKVNSESIDYLSSTDWYLLRELDGGTVMTADMKQLRVEARAKVLLRSNKPL
tara:strand:- start:18 stop:359 length:342 start_codon:yes stop_codon:yes gene_type:complete